MARKPADAEIEAPKAPVAVPHAAPAPAAPSPDPLPGASAAPVVGVEEFLPMAIPEAQRRGPGRRLGSVNIRTNTTFMAAISRYGDPLIASIAMGNMPTRELIQELRAIASDCGVKLGATVMDVVRFQEQCRASATPYGHAKRAATDEKGDPVVPMIGIGKAENVHFHGAGRSIEDEIDAKTIDAKAVDKQEDSGNDGE